MAEYTREMFCPVCEKNYVATVSTERSGGEISWEYGSPCPRCETPGLSACASLPAFPGSIGGVRARH
jgi:hypothetical protein